jgi:hypothetical protein
VRVVLLYFDGCPNWVQTAQRLREALVLVGRSGVVVEQRKIETSEEAVRARFLGSPTILIDGQDPFDPRGTGFGLTCRIYETPDGMQGSPTIEQLVDALS